MSQIYYILIYGVNNCAFSKIYISVVHCIFFQVYFKSLSDNCVHYLLIYGSCYHIIVISHFGKDHNNFNLLKRVHNFTLILDIQLSEIESRILITFTIIADQIQFDKSLRISLHCCNINKVDIKEFRGLFLQILVIFKHLFIIYKKIEPCCPLLVYESIFCNV